MNPAKIRFVIIGLNFGMSIAKSLLEPGKHPDIELIGVCDFDQAKAAQFAAANHIRHYAALEEVLRDPAVDAVGLYTPPGGRAKLIDRFIDAKKAVMTTKPFEDDPAEAERILQRVKRESAVLHLNSPSPERSKDMAQIKRWREEYKLGEPVTVFWETHANYREVADGSWMDDPAKCPAAPIFRLGIYGINDLIDLCGTPLECKVLQSRRLTGRPTADNGGLLIKFANGAIGSICASFNIAGELRYMNTLIAYFENGTVSRGTPADDSTGDKRILQLRTADGRHQTVTYDKEDISGNYDWIFFARAVREKIVISDDYANRLIDSVKLIRQFRDASGAGS